MHIIVASLNHHTAPVEVREKFVFAEDKLDQALNELKQTKSILEGVIVSTCNRMEIYAVVDRLYMCGHYLREFIERWFDIPRSEFSKYLHIHEDSRAIEHLFKVTCGLDSMIIGETQILGQVRDAFLLAQREKTTGTLFNMLFKQAVTLAKRAHTETAINDNPVSVSYAAVELGKRIFSSYRNRNVMIIGAGKMSELTVKHLRADGAGKVVVANRTLARAQELTERLEGIACTLDEVEHMLVDQEIDIIITSTGSQGYVLTREQTEAAMKHRSNKPLFMIDIAVPRDLDPEIAELNNVFLYDIDDLQAIVDNNLASRMHEAEKIAAMIQVEMEAFQQWYRTLGVSPVIRALQMKAAAIHQETMESMLNKLPDLDEHEIKVIRKLSKSIANQILHDPILRIKELAAERSGEDAIKLFTQVFALEEGLANNDASEVNTILEKSPAAEPVEKPGRSTLPVFTRTPVCP